MDEERRAFLDGEPESEFEPQQGFKLSQFIKSFIITMLSLILIVVGIGGFIFLRLSGGFAARPEIPSINPPPISNVSPTPDTTEEPEEDESDFIGEIVLAAPERFTDENRKDNFFTFLVVGLNEGTNANTVMVASFDANIGEAHIISIPRDSMLNVTRNNRKLSSSYMVGASGGRGREGGVASVQREVMSIIGFVPDFHIIIDYDAFFAIIDVVGGIEIDVPFHMRYDDPLQNLHIDILPGLQVMDSRTALHFARYRTGNAGFPTISDYRRIENQQKIIDAVIANILRPRNLLRTNEFIRVFDEGVYSNLTRANLMWFATKFSPRTFRDQITFHTTPMLGTTGSPSYYERLDARGILELINETINPFTTPLLISDLNIVTE